MGESSEARPTVCLVSGGVMSERWSLNYFDPSDKIVVFFGHYFTLDSVLKAWQYFQADSDKYKTQKCWFVRES